MNQESINNQKNTFKFFIQSSIFIICFISASGLQAQIIKPSSDSYVSKSMNQVNYGKTDGLNVGADENNQELRTYIRFNLGDYDMTKIESATLRLYNNDISGKQGFHIGIHTVKVNWEEGTNNDKFSVAMALPGELTWSNQPTFSPDPIMILNVGSYAGKWVDVDITPIAKIWKSKANHGLVLSPLDAIKGTSCSFSSKEYRSTEKRPHLILRGLNGSQVLVKNNL